MFLKKYPPSPAQKKIRWPLQLEIAGEVPVYKSDSTIYLLNYKNKNIRWELVPALWMEDDLAKWYLTPLGPKDRFIELNLMSCLDVVWLDLYNPNFHTPFIVYLAGLASISLHKLNRCILHLSWLVAIYISHDV